MVEGLLFVQAAEYIYMFVFVCLCILPPIYNRRMHKQTKTDSCTLDFFNDIFFWSVEEILLLCGEKIFPLRSRKIPNALIFCTSERQESAQSDNMPLLLNNMPLSVNKGMLLVRKLFLYVAKAVFAKACNLLLYELHAAVLGAAFFGLVVGNGFV